MIASPARMPVSNAWPMPSPVNGSHAAAASPTNRVRVDDVEMSSIRAGIGHAFTDPSSTASGPRSSAMCGRASRSAHTAFMSPTSTLPPRWIPNPMLARPSGSGNDQ